MPRIFAVGCWRLPILDTLVQFGKDRVTSSEVLHVIPGNPQATIVGDLSTGEGIPSSGV